MNFFGHKVQANGFSPVCPLICSFKWLFLLNPFAQKEQTKGLSFSDLTRALKSITLMCYVRNAQMQSYYDDILLSVKVLTWGSSIILDQNKKSVT